MTTQRIIPGLDVSDLRTSLGFYVGALGCARLHAEEGSACLDLGGAQLMLRETPGLAYPCGRGVDFRIEVADAAALFERVRDHGIRPTVMLEEKWHRTDVFERGSRAFAVADPDGYQLRFVTDLGNRTRISTTFRDIRPKLIRLERSVARVEPALPVDFTRASGPEV